GGVEPTAQGVIRHRQVVVGVRGGAAEPLRGFRGDAGLPHQPGDGVDAAVVAAGGQLGVEARAAVAGLGLGVDGPDLHEESVLPLLAGAAGALPPGVGAGGGNGPRFTEQTDRPPVLVLVDEAEGHVASLAKNAAAFFRMSRSASRRLFSARRRRSSSSTAEGLPWPGKACSPLSWRACFQLRMRFSLMPRERAASATE